MKILKVIVILLLFATPLKAEGFHRFSAGLNTGYTTLLGGTPPWYTVENTYGLKFDTHLKNNWRLGIGFSKCKIYDDSSADNEFKFGSDDVTRGRSWNGYDLSMFLDYRLMPYSSRFSVGAGFGGGISVWKISDADTDTTLKAIGERGETVDLAATEIILLSRLGAEYRIHPRFKLGLDLYANYLTGAGLEFDQVFEDDLSKWQIKVAANLTYMFGMGDGPGGWKSGRSREVIMQPVYETDKHVPQPQEIVIPVEKRADADGDGIPDFSDDCPETPSEAYGMVDLRGCPVDVDCDGVPDYLDNCPRNRLGALVDGYGCPTDGDNDGVPDGLDNCPDSDSGLAVDHNGCIDLSILEKPVILNIKYQSGSFEIDRATKEILNGIARILIKAPGVRTEINGYTDNIGTSEANKGLSQKRANRVRDYLVNMGVDKGRLTPVGRGEANFIASNDTREGRQKNRRVELVFFIQ